MNLLSIFPEEIADRIAELIAYVQSFGFEALVQEHLGIDLAPLAGFSSLLSAIGFGLSLLVYLLNTIAMVRMSVKTNTRGGWMAFFPLLDVWQLGRVADAGTDERKHAKRIMGTFFWTVLTIVIGVAAIVLLPTMMAAGNTLIVMVLSIAAIAAIVAAFVFAIMHQIYKWIAECRICVNFGSAGWFVAIFLTGWFGLSLIPAILRQVLANHTPKYKN